MPGGFDFTEFVEYRNNFMKMYLEFTKWLINFLNTEGMRFIRDVKLRTPVDTGDLRNHWIPSGVTRSGDTLRFWFTNVMEYATFVEYGHAKPYKSGALEGSADWVEGYFMMTITIDEIERKMPLRYEKAFQFYLKEMGLM